MQRVMVIGNGGAGKSTFCESLGAVLGLPVVHLDLHYWKPGWSPTATDEWHKRVAELANGERWIMDGNYRGTLRLRMSAADTIIYLDMPRLWCLLNVFKRWARGRVDRIPGCKEKVDLQFARWIWNYPRRNHPENLALLDEFKAGRNVIILSGRKSAERFLESPRRA